MPYFSPIKPFKGITSEYSKLIQAHVGRFFHLLPLPVGTTKQDIEKILAEIVNLELNGEYFEPDEVIHKILVRTDKNLENRIRNEAGIDLSLSLLDVINNEKMQGYVTRKIEENAHLIKKLDDEIFNKIVAALHSSISNPSENFKETLLNLKDEIGKLRISTTNRARLIARDQTAKIQSQIYRKRVEGLGSDKYKWITSSDERVRPTHVSNHNKVFRWDTPPPETGHVGDDIQCRCTASAFISIEALRDI